MRSTVHHAMFVLYLCLSGVSEHTWLSWLGVREMYSLPMHKMLKNETVVHDFMNSSVLFEARGLECSRNTVEPLHKATT